MLSSLVSRDGVFVTLYRKTASCQSSCGPSESFLGSTAQLLRDSLFSTSACLAMNSGFPPSKISVLGPPCWLANGDHAFLPCLGYDSASRSWELAFRTTVAYPFFFSKSGGARTLHRRMPTTRLTCSSTSESHRQPRKYFSFLRAEQQTVGISSRSICLIGWNHRHFQLVNLVDHSADLRSAVPVCRRAF